MGAALAIISTPGWIQLTNYLCCPGSLRFKYQVNPIICSLPSLPEPSVFHGKEAQGLSTGPCRTWGFPTSGEGRISRTRVQPLLSRTLDTIKVNKVTIIHNYVRKPGGEMQRVRGREGSKGKDKKLHREGWPPAVTPA